MITVISGTNRKNSMTLKVAQLYYDIIAAKNLPVQLLNLENIAVHERNQELIKLEEEVLIPTEKFIFVMPEYNGSFPGILKLMIDNSDIKKCWWFKKAALVGVADGRGGNLRGIEHMTNIFHYLKMNVFYNKLPISRIHEEMSDEGRLLKPVTAQAIQDQIDAYLKY
jgi:chromate reductase